MIRILKLLHPPTSVDRKLPANFSDGDLPYFSQELSRELGSVYLYELNDVDLTRQGVVIDGRSRIFPESWVGPQSRYTYGARHVLKTYFTHRKLTLSAKKLFLVAFDAWSIGYFHWLCDVLPRILSVEDFLDDLTLLLPDTYDSFQLESLSIFNSIDVELIPADAYVRVPRALMPGHIALSGNYRQKVMKEIRGRFHKMTATPTSSTGGGPHLYVSRARATRRRIINEGELITGLQNEGYEVIRFEEYPFVDQVQIAQRAESMISLHGAGLTNMLFMRPDATVMEFRMRNDTALLCYFSLASAMGLDYYYDWCTPSPPANRSVHADVIADVPRALRTARALRRNIQRP